MLSPEELFENIIFEEGQDLLGLDFIYKTLGLSMPKISRIFDKTVQEYGKRIPISETIDATTNPIILPKNTISARAIRFAILPQAPRYIFTPFGLESFEVAYTYDNFNKTITLKQWPPIQNIKVTLTRGYTLTRDLQVNYSLTYYENEEFETTLCNLS